jgi:UDP-N-acetylmuramate dehydrogenase
MEIPSYMQADFPLASLTTLGIGGAADLFVDAMEHTQIVEAADFAARHQLPLTVIGGGSNVVISDAGIRGVVLRVGIRHWDEEYRAEQILVSVGAGEDWNATVEKAIENGWAGIECLTGIPGRVGAAPMQNIGAYGQEVSEVIARVTTYNLCRKRVEELSPEDCQFGYRTSRFKSELKTESIILSVQMKLTPNGPPAVRYGELKRRITEDASLRDVATEVRALRASKSMLAGGQDGNCRSAGSFFLNPVLGDVPLDALRKRLPGLGYELDDLPQWVVGKGVKVPAAWLIERAGFKKGVGDGPVGLSSKHTLALINRGGASATDLIRFAKGVSDGVYRVFGVRLEPEPRFIGFAHHPFGVQNDAPSPPSTM